ncbi:hypothetical protein WJX73_002269 [Symbiochloris irregularis]|uniref:Uncharacterized protein n=1 Tax=Symbiochloris irregularis TaxID=706552 RepID=A0AAW1NPN5_9CHLO
MLAGNTALIGGQLKGPLESRDGRSLHTIFLQRSKALIATHGDFSSLAPLGSQRGPKRSTYAGLDTALSTALSNAALLNALNPSGLAQTRSGVPGFQTQWPSEVEAQQIEAVGSTTLIAAVQQGLVTHYGRLLASKQVSAKNRRGDTALHWAAFRGDLTAVEALHKADPDLDAVGDLGNRPLHLAVSQGHWAVTRYLLGHGANMV